MIPYATITEKADRRWTHRLLDRFDTTALPAAEMNDLVRALQAVSDPRSFATLEYVLTDAARPTSIRDAASSALRGMQYVALDVAPDKLLGWWLNGDAVLLRHALRSMDGVRWPDTVVQVASNPTHPLQAEALGRMDFWFDLPEHEAVKIKALSHPDPRVRAAAAYVLLWDEPVAAELPLIEATRDPVPEVVAEAANTLEYYPTLRVISRLSELLHHADGKVREEAEDSFQSIRNALLIRLSGLDCGVAEHIREWLRPIWDILAFSDDELRHDEDEDAPAWQYSNPNDGRDNELTHEEDTDVFLRQEERIEAMPLADVQALLADPDASPVVLGDRLRSNGWSRYVELERGRLRPLLLTHADQLVREQAAWIFTAWRYPDGLLGLLQDHDFCVRKSAMYNLSQLPPIPGLAELAWDHLQRHNTLGTHANETLAAFVRHADPGDAARRLGWIAGDHGRREGLRVAAVDHLAKLGAGKEVGQLAGLLREPPTVTWALHLRLLAAIVNMNLPTPDLSRLREVDNLHVQAAVARAEAG